MYLPRIISIKERIAISSEFTPGERDFILECINDALLAERALARLCGEYEPEVHRIEHDGFEGNIIGGYVTREGKRGMVLQQVGTRVVHVYGEKWLR